MEFLLYVKLVGIGLIGLLLFFKLNKIVWSVIDYTWKRFLIMVICCAFIYYYVGLNIDIDLEGLDLDVEIFFLKLKLKISRWIEYSAFTAYILWVVAKSHHWYLAENFLKFLLILFWIWFNYYKWYYFLIFCFLIYYFCITKDQTKYRFQKESIKDWPPHIKK